MKTKRFAETLVALLMLALLIIATACGSSDSDSSTGDGMDSEHMDDEEMDHEEMDSDEMDHAHPERVPNDGASIAIIAPADGAVFTAGEEIVVEVEIENFELVDGQHWHVYIDGSSYGMVVGGNLDEVLRGVEPGTHRVEAYLSLTTHEELEDGAAITITVEPE